MSDTGEAIEAAQSDAPSPMGDGRKPKARRVVRCDGCGAELDPLRAGHVAIFDAKVRHFCGYATCRRSFLGLAPEPPAPRAAERVSLLPALLAPISEAEPARLDDVPLPDAPRHAADELIEPVAPIVDAALDDAAVPMPERDMGALLLGLTLVAGLLAMALELADSTPLVRTARLVLVGVSVATIAGHAATARGIRLSLDGTFARDEASPPWGLAVVGPALSFLAAFAGYWLAETKLVDRALFLAATIVSVEALLAWLAAATARPIERGRAWILQRLGPSGPEASSDSAQVVLRTGELARVDLEVVSGEAVVASWGRGATQARRQPGDNVAAGMRVVAGELRGRVTRRGSERTLARALFSPAHRADVHAELVRTARRIVSRWSPVVAIVAALIAYALRARSFELVLVAVGVYASLSNAALVTVPSLTVARGLLEALERGILFSSARAWDRAGRATVAVFCARGTLLRGEPELVEVEVFGGGPSATRSAGIDDVLGLGAAALSVERHPVAIALRRAAKQRGVLTDLVRNARSHEGRGVTAVGLAGEAVVVGTREFLIERRVSIAVAEDAMAKLEASGRTVVLVARAGRLFGVCALQDGLRTGARAAVQHLLDARLEPVLLSSDTVATCEAIGRALDIDHLRAEVRDDERGAAIERIRDTGALVVALGHAPADDAALRAADVSVVLAGAGRAIDDTVGVPDEVVTVTDDVRDAALAVALAQRWRARATTALAVAFTPAAFGALVVAGRLLPPEYAPIALLLGALTAAWPLVRDGHEG